MKKVSVIIPVYKVEKYLKRCVESVLAQTYDNIGIILVDDGSPDGCPEICEYYEREHGNIQVVHKENGGLSSARKVGFNVADGDYILFVDSDDSIEPDMVEELVNAIERDGSDLSMCTYSTVKNGKKSKYDLPFGNGHILNGNDILKYYQLPLLGYHQDGRSKIPGFMCIRLFRRDLIKHDFFLSEREYFLEDHIFNLLYVDNVKQISIVSKHLYNYYVYSTSLSNTYRKGKWNMYCKIASWFKNYSIERNIDYNDDISFSFLQSAVAATIDNAVYRGSYILFVDEIKSLLKDDLFKKTIEDKKYDSVEKSRRFAVSCVKSKLFLTLYLFRKFSMIKNSL